jgi:hypothetical protein
MTPAAYSMHQKQHLMKTTIAVNLAMILLYYFLLQVLLPY